MGASHLRLALIEALLDGSERIQSPHLEAAYAIWRYSRQCIMQIFGLDEFSFRAEQVRRVLSADWQSKTQINKALSNHLKSTDFDDALKELGGRDLIEIVKEQTGGSPVTLVRLKNAS